MGIAKVTRNYQVTIPRDVRRIKNIGVGDSVLFAIEGSRIDFLKLDREKILAEAAGAWKGKMKEDGAAYVKKLRNEWNIRAKRLGI